MTSRQRPDLYKVLRERGATHAISRRDNVEGVKRFVRARVRDSPRLNKGFKELGQDPVEIIAERVKRDISVDCTSPDMLERTISAEEFATALEKTPPTMDKMYDEVLDRARERGNYDWIIEVLGWVMIAPSPFSVPILKTAVRYPRMTRFTIWTTS
jgi:hypothetical protein